LQGTALPMIRLVSRSFSRVASFSRIFDLSHFYHKQKEVGVGFEMAASQYTRSSKMCSQKNKSGKLYSGFRKHLY